MTTEKTLKFSEFLTTRVVAVTVAKSKTFHLHSELLALESETSSKSLKGPFKEAAEGVVSIDDVDPELFGFFVEYLYRETSILSREVGHYTEYVTLARLYTLGERLLAAQFQAYCLWRFVEDFDRDTSISDESICDLLQIACIEIPERAREDPLRSHILWYGGSRMKELQNVDAFRQLLCDIPNLGKLLCLWVGKSQPPVPSKPNELLYERFKPESEFPLKKMVEASPKVEG